MRRVGWPIARPSATMAKRRNRFDVNPIRARSLGAHKLQQIHEILFPDRRASRARRRQRPEPGLIHHSDRGVQYASHAGGADGGGPGFRRSSGMTTHVNKVHHVTTITQVAKDLGEDEDWLPDIAIEMEIEDGPILVMASARTVFRRSPTLALKT